jgi:predicted DNA-binding ribbon-helix-helix protein
MCRIYASIGPDQCAPVTRSVRLNRFVTSIRLEARFWTILDAMASQEGMTTPRFLGKLYDEVLEERGEVGNFASLLRVACTLFVERQASAIEREARISGEKRAPHPLPV